MRYWTGGAAYVLAAAGVFGFVVHASEETEHPPRCPQGRVSLAGVVMPQALRLLVLYDNYEAEEGTEADWGFSCLVDVRGEKILFDTGRRAATLEHNMEVLGVQPEDFSTIVISHDHVDHTRGLWAIVRPHHTVYLLAGFSNSLRETVVAAGATLVLVEGWQEIFPGVLTTGQMGTAIPEQALVITTRRGTVMITGCSHPGIVFMVERVADVVPDGIHLVAGGFHLADETDSTIQSIIASFRAAGVTRAGPSHCTGDHAIDMFRQEYGPDFVELGTGRRISVSGGCD